MSRRGDMGSLRGSRRAVEALRPRLEALIQAGIDLLDELDAALLEREPVGDDEVVSEDDGVVVGLREVGTVGAATGWR